MIVWSQCKHENILLFTGYHLGDGYDPAYLISPYMKNGNLKEYVKANSLSPEERLKFVRRMVFRSGATQGLAVTQTSI